MSTEKKHYWWNKVIVHVQINHFLEYIYLAKHEYDISRLLYLDKVNPSLKLSI